MKLQKHIHLLSWVRLVALSLLLGFGLLTGNVLASRAAHAQPAATIIVSTCDEPHLDSAISSAASGDTITFGCSGDIVLSSTLEISRNLTLDGKGQQVTLDGGNRVRVLLVDSGVSFTLNALAIAHGFVSDFGSGGGLIDSGGTVNISNSTFANNSATFGGGLYNESGTVNISNSTFANNSAGSNLGGDGGGLLNYLGTVSISNSTFANNSATFTYGGGLYNVGGTVKLGGSIMANNTGGNCSGGTSDQGYNLSSDSSCGFTGTGSLQNTNPKLASALASNGGPMQTLALLDGSPAINHIPASVCSVTSDQRGVNRPQGPACDIGAFEFRVPTLSLPSSPITVNATSDQGATVTYSVTASEPDDASATPAVNCSPTSGNTFPLGTTTVNCTASDAASPPDATTGSFQVVVKGTAAQVSDLVSLVNSFYLARSLQKTLDNKLQDVLTAINAGQTTTACSELTDFIGHVQSQSGKELTTSQASQLIAAAKQVQAVLGC